VVDEGADATLPCHEVTFAVEMICENSRQNEVKPYVALPSPLVDQQQAQCSVGGQ
jgi:hypothetical protein